MHCRHPVAHHRRMGNAHAARWLGAAFLLTLVFYGSQTDESGHLAPWLLLDLFLFYRISRGGQTARAMLVALNAFACALGLSALVASRVVENVGTGFTPLTVLAGAAWIWSLRAPALNRPVQGPREAPRTDALTP